MLAKEATEFGKYVHVSEEEVRPSHSRNKELIGRVFVGPTIGASNSLRNAFAASLGAVSHNFNITFFRLAILIAGSED